MNYAQREAVCRAAKYRLSGMDSSLTRNEHNNPALRAQALLVLHEQYGVTEKEVREIERLYDSVHTLPVIVHHPAIARIFISAYGYEDG
jgi:hypothetical protein